MNDHETMELDIKYVCYGIGRLAKSLDLNMELTQNALYTMILQYLDIRTTVLHPFEITWPKRRISKPMGWTENHEAIWTQWLEHTIPVDIWNKLIIEPVFGQDVRLWELNMESWRDEIYTFMPLWFARSMSRFEEIDPTAYPDDEEVKVRSEKKQEIDPYLTDYYERR